MGNSGVGGDYHGGVLSSELGPIVGGRIEARCCNLLPDGEGGYRRCLRKGIIVQDENLWCWFCLPDKSSTYMDDLEEELKRQRYRIVQRLTEIEEEGQRRRSEVIGQALQGNWNGEEVTHARGHVSGPRRPSLGMLDSGRDVY